MHTYTTEKLFELVERYQKQAYERGKINAALVEALERILEWDETGCDISRSAIENARIVLSQAKGGA